MSYSCLSLKTQSLRVVIKLELTAHRYYKISKVLPKMLSQEVNTFHNFFGNYIAVGGHQSIWENGNILDRYSFDDENWFQPPLQPFTIFEGDLALRQLVNSRRDEKGPFMVKIIQGGYNDGGGTILVSRHNSGCYEIEHIVQLKDEISPWGWFRKQEFFSFEKLFIIYWVNTLKKNDVTTIFEYGSEFFFKGGFLVWRKYNQFNDNMTSVIEYKLKRVFW